ncbi:MAG: PAN domain-containing protein [Sphingomonadales bacterium]|nr:PAN domain-containing protein [Sphingomonadales bacterium]
MRKFVAVAAALAALASPALLLAGPFAGPDLWTDPAPGPHLVRAQGVNLCAEREGDGAITRLPRLVLRPCDPNNFDQHLEFVPNGVTTAAPLNASSVVWRIMTREKCLTSARGVVFGPPAVDEVTCDTRPGDLPQRLGSADQNWFLVRVPDVGHYQVTGFDGRCWTAQGGDFREGVQLVMERCGAHRGQRFKVGALLGDVSTQPNLLAAEEFGWQRVTRPIPGGHARFRAMPGQNLPSGDYTTGIATADDRGQACAQLCAEDNQCRGFTWVDPRARGGAAMCYKKNALNAPVTDNFTNSGIVRP